MKEEQPIYRYDGPPKQETVDLGQEAVSTAVCAESGEYKVLTRGYVSYQWDIGVKFNPPNRRCVLNTNT